MDGQREREKFQNLSLSDLQTTLCFYSDDMKIKEKVAKTTLFFVQPHNPELLETHACSTYLELELSQIHIPYSYTLK